MDFSTPVQEVPDWLTRNARSRGDIVALEFDGGQMTYSGLSETAGSLARGLQGFGISSGQHVAILARQGKWFALALHALMQLGVVVVPVNWRLAEPEIVWQINDAGVQLILHDEAMSELAQSVASAASGSTLCRQLETIPLDGEAIRRGAVNLSHTCAIVYTSGTTGHAKGAILSYGNFLWSAMASALQLGLAPGDKWLTPLPLFHVGGMSVLMRCVIYGTTAVIQDHFSPDTVNAALDSGKITLLSAVPTMVSRMLEHRDKGYPAQLRCVLVGGSSAPRRLLETCTKLGIPVAQSYGLTETTSQVATLLPEDGLRKIGSSGKPLWPTEIEVRHEGKRIQALEIGDIVVRGLTVMQGYWQNDAESQRTLEGGWLHTGDIGYFDEEGYLFVLDRRRDLIISGGENIYPAEIEAVLQQHPAVEAAGVAAAPDDVWGQVPVAFVKIKGEAGGKHGGAPRLDNRNTERSQMDTELLQFCRQYLASYKTPKRFIYVDELPRNASGKLLRRNLREWLTK